MALILDIGVSNLDQSINLFFVSDYVNFISNLFKHLEKHKILTEKDDLKSWKNVYFYFPDISIDDIAFWDNLEDFAINNQLYITLYDLNTKEKLAYFFDEDEVWINLNKGLDAEYEEFVKNN